MLIIKKVLLLSVLMSCLGCATVHIPTYLADKNPYIRRFYANHEEALVAITKTLEDLGWEIEGTTDPSVYERSRTPDLDEREILLFTKIRQTPLMVGTRYAKINVFVRSKAEISEIEIRYLTTTSVSFQKMESYQDDSAVERMFARCADVLSG